MLTRAGRVPRLGSALEQPNQRSLHQHPGPQAGPAILLSYLLAGATALCGAAVMAEFSRELPMSGAGFTWTITTLGGRVGGRVP